MEWKKESKERAFTRTYVDDEIEDEEKKIHVRRTRESIPFGGHIKKAAFKAAF